MTNYGAKILNNSVSSLVAQQAVIATSANNIANVNTPGYTKRTVDLQTRGSTGESGVNVGNGVIVGDIQRLADNFLENQLRGALSDKSKYSVESDFMSRIASLYDLSGNAPTIGSTYTAFYTAVNDLNTNPSSIELRTNLIERGNDLVSAIKNTYNGLADLQTEADQRISTEIDKVNSLAAQVASLNGKISLREASGGVAGDERDQRDKILQDLAEKMSFSLVETSDGSANISLANGFNLVTGTTSRTLETTISPSFASSVPNSLSNGVLSYIVFDYDSSGTDSHIDLTQTFKSGSGSIGALLNLRGYAAPTNTNPFQADGDIVSLASRVEAISRELLTTVNLTYLGPDENSGTAFYNPSSADLDGTAPAVYGLFDFTYSGAKDSNANGQPDDLTTVGLNNYSSILSMAISNPRRVAAALDLDATAGVTSFAPGDGANLQRLISRFDTNFSFSQGGFSLTGTIDQAYDESVSKVGTLQSTAKLNSSVAESKYTAAAAHRDEVSAVSLDEEFTNLIRFQKAFEASGRMIKVAQDLLNEILQLI